MSFSPSYSARKQCGGMACATWCKSGQRHVGQMDLKKLILVCAFGFLAAGCAATDNREAATADDPLEPMNRYFFNFNQKLDRNAALPAATFYTDTMPNPARRSVHN